MDLECEKIEMVTIGLVFFIFEEPTYLAVANSEAICRHQSLVKYIARFY